MTFALTCHHDHTQSSSPYPSSEILRTHWMLECYFSSQSLVWYDLCTSPSTALYNSTTCTVAYTIILFVKCNNSFEASQMASHFHPTPAHIAHGLGSVFMSPNFLICLLLSTSKVLWHHSYSKYIHMVLRHHHIVTSCHQSWITMAALYYLCTPCNMILHEPPCTGHVSAWVHETASQTCM